MSRTLNVRAIGNGYYGDTYRLPGDEFSLNSESDFSSRWMVAIDAKGNALDTQPRAKGKGERVSAKDAAELAKAAEGEAGARQAQVDSAMAATMGELTKVVDTSTAADPDSPDKPKK